MKNKRVEVAAHFKTASEVKDRHQEQQVLGDVDPEKLRNKRKVFVEPKDGQLVRLCEREGVRNLVNGRRITNRAQRVPGPVLIVYEDGEFNQDFICS